MKIQMLMTAAVCAFGLGPSAHAAVITNGSFEDQISQFSGFQTLPATSAGLPGWTIGGNSVDLIGDYWTAEDGNHSLDLSGFNSGLIAQTITDLTVGALYQISFWLAGNPDSSADKSLSAGTTEGGSTYTFGEAGHTRFLMGWELKSFTFQAAADTTVLTFASLNADPFGPALDNISISEVSNVPLPAGGPLLLAGLAGLLSLRRRKSV